MAEIVTKILDTHGLGKQASFNLNFSQTYLAESPLAVSSNSFYNIALPLQTQQAQLNSITQELNALNLQFRLKKKLRVGDQFGNYGQIQNVFDDKKSQLIHKKGNVILLDVWATWCGPCQNPMSHNSQMLKKNQSWKDRVQIICVSVDEELQELKSRIQDKGWDNLKHLTLGSWNKQHKLIKDFGITGIPFVCVVDPQGNLNYIGHPNNGRLQERINLLLKGQSTSALDVQQKDNQLIKIDHLEQKLKKLRQNAKPNLLGYLVRSNLKFNAGTLTSSSLLQLHGTQDKQYLFELKTGFSQFKEVKTSLIEYSQLPSLDSPFCWQCASKLGYPFYWLKWTDSKFGCRKCVQQISTQEGGFHFKYMNNSVLLFGPLSKLADLDLGLNIQPADLSKVEPHSFGCNNCGKGCEKLGQCRWLCMICRKQPNFRGDKVDLCSKCMQLLIEEGGYLQSLKDQNHFKEHAWLRLLYRNNYYEY